LRLATANELVDCFPKVYVKDWMKMLKRAVHAIHMSGVAKSIRATPGVGEMAEYVFLAFQVHRMKSALKSIRVQPPLTDCDLGISVPKPRDLKSGDPGIVRAGNAFSEKMAKYCSTSKFSDIGYQDVYAQVLRHLEGRNPRVLEVGIGVNDPSAPSGMHSGHLPGASLNGWAGYFEGSEVHGADVDPRTLVNTAAYSTHFVNQLDSASVKDLGIQLGGQFDLIVDDGLHTAEANANTIAGLISLLSPCGVFVIEDILPRYDSAWSAAQDWIPSNLSLSFYPGSVLRGSKQEGIAVITWKSIS
jgi:hypothetical protein